MIDDKPWVAIYPKTAREISHSSIKVNHLAEVVGVAARKYGERPAVSTQLPNGACATLDFNEVDRLTSDFAVYLRDIAGLQAGDVVAVMSPNCIGFMLAAFGIFKAGCTCTNINPLYTAPEMKHQLEDSRARALVIIDLFSDKADAVAGATDVQHIIRMSLTDFFPPLKRWVMGFVLRRVKKLVPAMHRAHVSMGVALKKGAERRRADRTDLDSYRSGQSLDSIALYQYTGGTTGRSKGAELTHRNILFNALSGTSLIFDKVQPREDDCALVILPLYHITAFVLIMLPALHYGQHAIMVPNPRPPSNLQSAFENHAITHFSGINTLFAALLDEPWCTRERLQYLRFCGSGGSAQHVGVARRWEELAGIPILQGYGMTECAGVLTMSPVDANRLGHAGIPIPGMDVKIVDAVGHELPAGEAGEVVARGPAVM